MADNVDVVLAGVAKVVRTSEAAGIHTPHHINDVPTVSIDLLENDAETGEWIAWPGGVAFFDAWGGDWDGASVTLEQTPNGSTPIAYPGVLTANGAIADIPIPPGRLVRAAIATPGSSTSISAKLTRQF